jgi:thiol:disulfide interchange protein DsbC
VAQLIRLITLTIIMVAVSGTMALSAETLDLDKALRIGTGKTTVIEFTDPDCPYCRKAYQYFLTRPDVSLYVFFNPLSSHQNALQKARYILSSDDRERAYAEVMSGLFDSVPPSGSTEKGKKLLDEQMAIAKKMGIVEVPVFMVYGRIIKGFDPGKIGAVLPPVK